MIKWIKCSDKEPPHKHILIWCTICDSPHTVYYDYGEFCHYECCNEDGYCCPGTNVEFDYWQPLPERPECKICNK